MGTVLEMISQRGSRSSDTNRRSGNGGAPRISALALAVAVVLSGCSQADAPPTETGVPLGASGTEGRVLAGVSRLQGLFGGIGGEEPISAPRSIPGGFSPEVIAADQDLYRFVQINALGVSEPARVIQENGPEITLALQSGPTAAYDSGILAATRGFGDDLLTIDAPGLLAALRSGGGAVSRQTETLDAQDQIVTQTFACTITEASAETIDLGLRQTSARRLDEACRGETIGFDNIYWLDGTGAVIASRQYVSPTVAYLRANRL